MLRDWYNINVPSSQPEKRGPVPANEAAAAKARG
jgi:hypothetical protein